MPEQLAATRWKCTEVWPLVGVWLVGLATLLIGLDALPYHGEESRRVQIAREMLATGDFVVPRLQGQPWPTKPPLFYWLLAGVIAWTDSLDPWTLRLPSALATLATATLLVWYVRPALGHWGAFLAGFVFLTFGDTLDAGSDAEIDATFALWVTCALLLWHGGLHRGWSPWLYWSLGYGFTALAFLTKGLQGPIYFGAAASVWLLLTQRWRDWISPPQLWGHLLGLTLFLTLVMAWMGPFAMQQGSHALQAAFVSESVTRSVGGDWSQFVQHLWMFPVKWAGSLLPWSPWLVGYLWPKVRHQIMTRYAEICFAGLALGLAFPTCWLPPGGEERYLRPVLPCVAVLVASLLHLLAQPEAVEASLRWLWRGLQTLWAVVALAIGLGVLAISLLPMPGRMCYWQETWPVALAFAWCTASIGLALICLLYSDWSRLSPFALLAIGLLACICVRGVLTNYHQRRQVDSVGAVAALRQRMPEHACLISFGPVNHLFLLLYEHPIARHEWPREAKQVRLHAGDYFCFDAFRGEHPPLPFVWEEVARLTMDRTRRPRPDNVVIVGRRLEQAEALARRGEPRLHGLSPCPTP